jgi:ubiquinone/menaquinone biosynthesis C-methylase UbiE
MDNGLIYLEIGQRLFAKEGVDSVRFIQADVALLPFKAESFDFIFFSIYSLNGERRFEILSNVRKVIRPGGLLLLCACTPLYERKHPDLRGHTWMTSAEQMSQEVSRCGFKLLESEVDPERPEYRFAMLKESECR